MRIFLFTHTHTVSFTCCYDENKGIQDLKIFSSDSVMCVLSVILCLSVLLRCLVWLSCCWMCQTVTQAHLDSMLAHYNNYVQPQLGWILEDSHLWCASLLATCTAPPASLHLLPHCTSCLTAPPASLLATSIAPLCLTAQSSSAHEPSDSMLAVSSGVCTGLTTSSIIQSLCFLCSVIPTQLLHSQYTSIRTND